MIAIYCRQSVEKKNSISIDTQIDFCKREFHEEEFKTYVDKGFSGKNTNRPSFEQMINDIKTGSIDRVIVYKIDRISRSVLDFAKIIEIFNKYNVSFNSCTENFDTSEPMGRAMLSIIMVFAQLERETIQQRITDNYYARGKRGGFMGGRVPYGYNKIKLEVNGIKTSVLEEDTSQTTHIKKMFELYSNTNMSLGKISKYLNSENIYTASGKKWDSNKVSMILRSPLYVKADADVYLYYKNKGCIISNDISDFIGTNGCLLYGKRKPNERKFTNVENHVLSIGLHEGVVNSDIWLLCQYKLDNNKQVKNTGKGKYTWLSGIIKCGYCGYAMVVANNRGKSYFNCTGKRNKQACDGHSKAIHVKEIEKIIEKYLFKKKKELQNITIETKTNDSNINEIKIQIFKIDKQIENLINQMAEANEVVMKYINEKITDLDNTKKTLNKELQKINLKNSKSLPLEEVIEKVNNWKELKLEEKKEVCRDLIEKVWVKDDSIEVKYKNF